MRKRNKKKLSLLLLVLTIWQSFGWTYRMSKVAVRLKNLLTDISI